MNHLGYSRRCAWWEGEQAADRACTTQTAAFATGWITLTDCTDHGNMYTTIVGWAQSKTFCFWCRRYHCMLGLWHGLRVDPVVSWLGRPQHTGHWVYLLLEVWVPLTFELLPGLLVSGTPRLPPFQAVGLPLHSDQLTLTTATKPLP